MAAPDGLNGIPEALGAVFPVKTLQTLHREVMRAMLQVLYRVCSERQLVEQIN